MPDTQHPLERRAALLAGKLKGTQETIAAYLSPEGRQLFHQRLSKPEAIRWWRQHRHDPLGQEVLKSWQMSDVLELDLVLAQDERKEAFGLDG
jgi:hypothetical protein